MNDTISNSQFQSSALLIAPDQADVNVYDRLSKYHQKIFSHLPANTQKAYIADINDFSAWSARFNQPSLSSNAELNEKIIEAYFDDLMESQLSLATIERRLATISVFLGICMWPNPLKTSTLLKKHIRLQKQQKSSHQKQATPMQLNLLTIVNEKLLPESPMNMRDRLIVNIMYDGLLRSNELCNIKIEHVDYEKNTVFIPSSKTDKKKKGSYRFISNTSLSLVQEWQREFNIFSGHLIRRLSPKQTIQKQGIAYLSVYRTFHRISTMLKILHPLTTHSARVGGAVDMAENDIDILSIMRAGGWFSVAMPERYTEQAKATKAGMGQLAVKMNR